MIERELLNGERIKELRKKAGLTQEELAKRAGVSQPLIAKIEGGKVDPRVSTIKKILSVLTSEEKSVINASDIMTKDVIAGEDHDKIHVAVDKMKKSGVSQLPVLVNGRPVGAIEEADITRLLWKNLENPKTIYSMEVGEVLGTMYPMVPPDTPIDVVVDLLAKGHNAILVVSEGKLIGIITKIDVLTAMKNSQR
jgi:predicted transcriptional regulator